MADHMRATTTRPTAPIRGLLLRLAGASLLLATGGIHLDLYLTGYRHIPTIGPLFLLQVAAAFPLAALVLAVPRRLVALAGAGFALSTLGGYISSLWVGLFGFDEVRTTAGTVAGVVEIATFVALGAYAAWFAPGTARSPGALVVAGRRALAPCGALAALALALAVANASGTTTGPTRTATGASSATGGVRSVGSVKVAIENFAFVPASLAVTPGEKIVVTNHDSVTHTFTATPGSTPEGKFDSGDIAPGKTVTVTAPTARGSYAFHCAIHPFMTGTLTVK